MNRLLTRLVRWEVMLLVLIVAAMAWSASLSPYYLYLDQILASMPAKRSSSGQGIRCGQKRARRDEPDARRQRLPQPLHLTGP